MTDRATKPTGIAWDQYRRWFIFGRVFRLSIQARLLTLATVGVLATLFGWWGLAKVFSGTDETPLKELLKAYETCPWKARDVIGSFDQSGLDTVGQITTTGGPHLGAPVGNPYLDPWTRLSAPWRQLFVVSRSFTGAAFLLLCAIWAAAIWGLIGGAITRAVVVQLAREEAISLGSALRHASKRWKSYFAAPLFPLAAVAVVAIPAIFIGLLMQLSLLFGGILWPFVLLTGLIAAIMLVGLSVGWPLMHAAVSCEGSDSFDALSRSYSYVYQRPIHYLFYAVTATILGALGLFVVSLFAEAVQTLAAWSASWGSGSELMLQALNKSTKHSGADAWGAWLIWFWAGFIDVIVLGFAFAFFWTASTAIYLLLRHDVDGAELDETFLEEGETFGLPPLATDAAGVPVVPPNEAASEVPVTPPTTE